MIDFFIHDVRGVILRVGKAPESMVELQAQEGEFVVRGKADDRTQYVLDGELATYTEAEMTAKNSLPSGWDWQMPERVAVRTDTLDMAKARKITAFNEACTAAIVAGIESTALGAPHHYPTKQQDQANLVASVADSMLATDPDWTTKFWCLDEAQVWERRPHTVPQIQQVGKECKAMIQAAMDKNEWLRAQVAAAANQEELDAITWEDLV